MKLPKTLLKAVALGLIIGGAASSCTSIFEEQEEIIICGGEYEETGKSPVFDCPACGMG